MNKTVLFISAEPQHRALYERGLRKLFRVESCQVESEDAPEGTAVDREDVAAVIYDMARQHSPEVLRWIQGLRKPVVVLTPDDELDLPPVANRCVLCYPVGMDRILDALTRMGVESSPDSRR